MRRLDAAVDFVRRHVNKTCSPLAAGGFKQRKGAVEIGCDHRSGGMNAAVYMRFRCKVNDSIGRFFAKQGVHCFLIADIRLNKAVTRKLTYRLQIFEVSGISKLIEIYDVFRPTVAKRHPYKCRADEARATGNKQLHLCCSSQS